MKNIQSFFFFLICLILNLKAVAQNAPAPLKLVDFVLTPGAKDWNYKLNQTASVDVQVLKFGVPLENVSITYEIGPEMLPADKKGTLTLKNGTGKIEVGTSKQPGFRQLTIKTDYQGKTYTGMVKVGFSPEKIEPTVTLPSDFLQFWENAKSEAAKIPLDAIITPLPEYSTNTVEVYLVNLQNSKKDSASMAICASPKRLVNTRCFFPRPVPA